MDRLKTYKVKSLLILIGMFLCVGAFGKSAWIFEEESFVPIAKLQNGERFSIFTDHLGTPVMAVDSEGEKIWSRELDIYGKTRTETGQSNFVPFLYQGQYFDEETGLAYNRFRYYSPDSGTYISQDPIRLASGEDNLYAYVWDINSWIDPLGLMGIFTSVIWNATSSSGTGYTYKVFQQDIDFDYIDKKGRTNLERMTEGLAPIGSDGKSINLHHSKQKGHGPLFELSSSIHTKYGHTNALHPYRVTPNPDGTKFNPFDPVDRDAFNIDRKEYWRNRAETERKRRKLNNH